jgi:hypothetical protein
MLGVIMLTVIMLSVVMVKVVAPSRRPTELQSLPRIAKQRRKQNKSSASKGMPDDI